MAKKGCVCIQKTISAEAFRKQAAKLGYEVDFQKQFLGGNHCGKPIIKKDGKNLHTGAIYNRRFIETHKEILNLLMLHPFVALDETREEVIK